MSDHPAGYEKRDTSIRSIFLTALVSVVLIVVIVLVLYNYFINTREDVFSDQALKPVAPELPAIRRTEDSILGGYGLVDSAAGTYRIPIEQAMKLLAVDSASATSVK
jgi:hypothetical protein